MKTQPLKILTNVFICTRENRLQLVDIYFNSKIERIEPSLDTEIDWRDISDKEKWEAFKEEIPEQKFPPQLKTYDGNFMLLIPGAIDTHVHFNTPGFEHHETFETGSLAAAYGGVTTVVDMPCTSKPPVTSIQDLIKKRKFIEGKSWVDYAFWGGVRGEDFDNPFYDQEGELLSLGRADVVGFKAYLISGMKGFRDLVYEEMLLAAKSIKKTGKPLAVHAEDKHYISYKLSLNRGKYLNNWREYCEARDDIAEAKAIATMVRIAKKTKCPIHIVHLSSELGLEVVRKAQLEGLKFTAETCPHFLYFTQKDFQNEEISNFLKTAPPVKLKKDRDALWDGLSEGTISFVTTDHAGCDPIKEKSSWNFWEVYGGIPGVEHRVPFLFSEGFKKGRLTLSQTIRLLSTNPAIFTGLKNKGSLDEEKDADFTLIDLWDNQVVKAENMHSKGKYSPFEGVKFGAIVEATFLRGNLIMKRDGESEVDVGYGKFLEG